MNKKIFVPQGAGRFIEECLFVGGDILMSDGCEYAHFIECVFLLSVGQVAYFDFFQRVLQTILRPFYLVNAGIGAVTYLCDE